MADLDAVEREAKALRERLAACEAALRRVDATSPDEADYGAVCAQVGDALSGGTSALDAVVAAAVDAERARVRAAVGALPTVSGTIEAVGHREWRPNLIDVRRVDVDDMLAAIGGAS